MATYTFRIGKPNQHKTHLQANTGVDYKQSRQKSKSHKSELEPSGRPVANQSTHLRAEIHATAIGFSPHGDLPTQFTETRSVHLIQKAGAPKEKQRAASRQLNHKTIKFSRHSNNLHTVQAMQALRG